MTWWIVTTGPSLERRAAAGMADLGFETWLPLHAFSYKNARMKRVEWRTRLTYAGYVFVGIGDAAEHDAWHAVRQCDGVIRPLTCGGGARVFHFTDAEFSTFAAGFTCPITQMVEDAWCIGDTVRVTEGPFVSIETRIRKVLRGGRFRVEIDFMGQSTPVEFRASQLEKV